MKQIVLGLFIIFNVSSLALISCSEKTQNENAAVIVMQQFCAADLNGQRLSSETYSVIQPLVAYEEEPGWDGMVIIDSFEIGRARSEKDQIIIPVKYRVLGMISGLQWIPLEEAEQNYRTIIESRKEFHLIKTDGIWKIKQPIIHPHISVLMALNHLRPFLADYSIGKRQDGKGENLKQSIDALEQLLNHNLKEKTK